ncbi:MAG: HNH endonuclease, partial [Dehalococcoidia bacterium]|nr:HNH endonuclease [Dehalococcoidia bacterium]
AGSPVMKRNQYAIDHLHVTRVTLTPGTASLQLRSITLRNQMHEAEEIMLGDRLELLHRIWADSDKLPDDIASLISQHETHVAANGIAGAVVEKIVARLEALVSESAQDLDIPYNEGTDALEALAEALDLVRTEPVVQLSEVDPEEPALRRRVLGEWKRWARSRGAASAKFRAAVRSAYKSTCAVCGKHLPATAKNRMPGVDAAHILPWAEYDLDHISNGISLCKNHHWAFDEGLIRIRLHSGEYQVEVPSGVSAAIVREHPNFSLALLIECEGRIPIQRLPEDPAARPHQAYLKRLNDELDMI